MLWRHRVRTSAFRAEALAEALGGTPCGDGWMACCPAHDDRTPSLSIHEVDGKTLFHCFAGCSQDEVLAAFRARGFWPGRRDVMNRPGPRSFVTIRARTSKRMRFALGSCAGCPRHARRNVSAGRHIDISPPSAFGSCPSIKHTPTGLWWPAMVALVADMTGEPMAIHRPTSHWMVVEKLTCLSANKRWPWVPAAAVLSVLRSPSTAL